MVLKGLKMSQIIRYLCTLASTAKREAELGSPVTTEIQITATTIAISLRMQQNTCLHPVITLNCNICLF